MKQEALIGRTIAGKYRIDSLVGQGAMGAVWKARQTTLDTTLAIKILHRHLAGDPMFAARFLREAQAASRVDHPSSMRVIDFGEEPDGLLYIAMEYVDGKTLARIIEECGPLEVERIVDIACQALAALSVAHDLGVIHRDLKPENIMVIEGEDDEGRTHDIVKVCDFGVAKLLERGSREPSVTAEGAVIGTPEYMSPEQARGEALDARSDVYSMGVLLFQLMTGKVPFDSSTAFGTALMHVNDEPTRPRLINPRVDSRLERICLKAMQKRPGDRYGSARELRGELRALLGQDDAYADDAPAESKRTGGLLQQIEARPRRTGLVVSGVVVLAGVVAGAIFYPRAGAGIAPHERVQTATITSGVMPAARAPVMPPPQIVDTTLPGAPGADPTAVAPALSHAAAPAAAQPVMRVRAVPRMNARRGAASKGRDGEALPPGTDEIPQLPDPNAAATTNGKSKHGKAADKPAVPDKPAAADKPAVPAAPAAPDKPAAADKPAAVEKPSAKPAAPAAKPDPADAPLPVFPIPSSETP